MNWEMVSTSVAMAGVVIAMWFAVHVVWKMEEMDKDGDDPHRESCITRRGEKVEDDNPT